MYPVYFTNRMVVKNRVLEIKVINHNPLNNFNNHHIITKIQTSERDNENKKVQFTVIE